MIVCFHRDIGVGGGVLVHEDVNKRENVVINSMVDKKSSYLKFMAAVLRALREGDPAFTEELRVLQLATFKDDSSPIGYLCECYSGTRDLDSEKLLEQLPSLQQLLYRLMACKVRFNHYSVHFLKLIQLV
ncbi:hypothetical protein Hanom_Chr13g01238941 [Helianthus anomalus]